MKRPVALIIMDGLGLTEAGPGNAVSLAKKPVLDRLFDAYPHNTLTASGLAVGLPEGQMGNSEVGHLNIGGGRIVYQSLTRIHQAIKDQSFFQNPAYLNAVAHVKKNHSKLHIMGLLSDGGVHSHIDHFKAILTLAKKESVAPVYVHAYLDGRDVPPQSSLQYFDELEGFMETENVGKIATVHGRYYAMDRDKRAERTGKSYDLLTHFQGPTYQSATEGVKANYDAGIHDEFVVPFGIDSEGTIGPHDAVIFMNFRPDRAIQMSVALTNPEKSIIAHANPIDDLFFVSTMHYSYDVLGEIAFGLQTLDNMYGDVVAQAGLKQLRAAETEKYPHVTFFFDGGVDKEIPGAKRILVNSPKVATYDMQPEMSAYELTERVLKSLDEDDLDTVILNFANPDMVGHTGDIEATVKAVETVDECTGKIVDKVLELGGVAIVTADHGNAEKMIAETGKPHTAHTTNLVPVIITDKHVKIRDGGILGDLTPTMLDYLDVEKPKEMTGSSLIQK